VGRAARRGSVEETQAATVPRARCTWERCCMLYAVESMQYATRK